MKPMRILSLFIKMIEKKPSRCVLRKRCFENILNHCLKSPKSDILQQKNVKIQPQNIRGFLYFVIEKVQCLESHQNIFSKKVLFYNEFGMIQLTKIWNLDLEDELLVSKVRWIRLSSFTQSTYQNQCYDTVATYLEHSETLLQLLHVREICHWRNNGHTKLLVIHVAV